MSLLALASVSKRCRSGRRETVVLERASLEIDPGERVGVWGLRRSGKSTLLRVAAGLERPDGGTVRFDGEDVWALPDRARALLRRRSIGFASPLAGADAIWHASRVASIVDHVALPLLADGWPPSAASARAVAVLERLGAIDCAGLRPAELSPGEATRVAVARALVREPRLFVVDEPAITPNPRERDEIRHLLATLADEDGLALLVASEDVSALRGSSRVLTVADGRLASSSERGGEVVPLASRRSRSGGERRR
jgi:predicted ABC-type transport system involved in lysophospholipase L1 biosynthesis ATPase subunit